MSPKLKKLSGKEVAVILGHFGFVVHSQKGSHAKLRRTTSAGEKQTLTIPVHDELDVGTLRAILRQASRYVSLEQLQPFFFGE